MVDVAAGNPQRSGQPDFRVIDHYRHGNGVDDRRGDLIDDKRLLSVESNRAGKLVASQPGEQRIRGQQSGDALRAFHEHLIAGAVPAVIIDLLELVEVDHHQRDDLPLGGGTGDQFFRVNMHAAAIEIAGQGVGLGQDPRLFLGLAAFLHLFQQLLVTAPSEDDQGNVQQQGIDHDLVGTKAQAGERLDDSGEDLPAGSDEHDDGGSGDAQGKEIALGILHAISVATQIAACGPVKGFQRGLPLSFDWAKPSFTK